MKLADELPEGLEMITNSSPTFDRIGKKAEKCLLDREKCIFVPLQNLLLESATRQYVITRQHRNRKHRHLGADFANIRKDKKSDLLIKQLKGAYLKGLL